MTWRRRGSSAGVMVRGVVLIVRDSGSWVGTPMLPALDGLAKPASRALVQGKLDSNPWNCGPACHDPVQKRESPALEGRLVRAPSAVTKSFLIGLARVCERDAEPQLVLDGSWRGRVDAEVPERKPVRLQVGRNESWKGAGFDVDAEIGRLGL